MDQFPDAPGKIADAAISQLGAHAKAIERVAMRLPDNADRMEIVWLVESLRDHEQRLRDRIRAMTEAAR
ncbi:hypothetical protein [Sphingomonas sp. R86521]|uniref:hypothetical protein n=1 Tax=Sphingomonas sp. R86521 TaxID=3093860 RepID=UPI0036D22664